jgi:hypothetical protein
MLGFDTVFILLCITICGILVVNTTIKNKLIESFTLVLFNETYLIKLPEYGPKCGPKQVAVIK